MQGPSKCGPFRFCTHNGSLEIGKEPKKHGTLGVSQNRRERV